MSLFFPPAESKVIAPGINSLSFRDNDTEVILSSIAPGAILNYHSHPEAQMGLALAGTFEMEVGDKTMTMSPLQYVYAVDPHVPHAARNPFAETALGLDVKRASLGEEHRIVGENLLPIFDRRTFKTGLENVFFVGPWFEVMISRIPPGGYMPVHKHTNQQIGVAVTGRYVMQVGNEEEDFESGQVYFAPGGVPHGAYNPYREEACSINIFVPPRYHRYKAKGNAHAAAAVG